MLLPLFHEGTQLITPVLGYRREGNEVIYLHGMMPVFLHQTDDIASFRMIISQFYINGIAKQSELVRTFAINPLALKRWVKKYREEEPKAYYEKRRRLPEVLKKAPEREKILRFPRSAARTDSRSGLRASPGPGPGLRTSTSCGPGD